MTPDPHHLPPGSGTGHGHPLRPLRRQRRRHQRSAWHGHGALYLRGPALFAMAAPMVYLLGPGLRTPPGPGKAGDGRHILWVICAGFTLQLALYSIWASVGPMPPGPPSSPTFSPFSSSFLAHRFIPGDSITRQKGMGRWSWGSPGSAWSFLENDRTGRQAPRSGDIHGPGSPPLSGPAMRSTSNGSSTGFRHFRWFSTPWSFSIPVFGIPGSWPWIASHDRAA